MVFMLEGNAIHHRTGLLPSCLTEHSLAQSSRLTFLSFTTGSSWKGLQITFKGKIQPCLYTLRKQTYVWVEGRISTSSPGRSFINWIFCHYSPGTLETEPRRWWRVSVQICVEIMSSCRLKIRMSPLPEMIHSSVPLDHNHLIFI